MSISQYLDQWGHEQVVFCNDKNTNLRAIIAIHDTTLGPALGGCRFWDYKSEDEALFDVMRLSRGMTYKAAMAGLKLGGGKSVIIGDPKKLKSEEFFRAFGRFVDSLGGRYITAEDVNIKVDDMDHVAKETKHVTGISKAGGSGDPSPLTALGVFHGIRASVKFKLNKDQLNGLTVAIQGCGSVGSHLCELLHEAGAKLLVSDINDEATRVVRDRFGAEIVDNKTIHTQEVDVFSPCALGAGLNDETIPQLNTGIVAGAANNQLLDETKHMNALHDRGICYAPDYVINAGGLINVYHELHGYNYDAAKKDVENIYKTVLEILTLGKETNTTTAEASNKLAEERIAQVAAEKKN